jgi:Kef-type K+ transport system membrane component KefB
MEFGIPITDPVVQLTIVVLAALLVQIPLEHSRIPGLAGLLLLGMLVGPGGLGVLSDEPVVDLLGSVGLLFIMFLAGMEVDLDLVRERKKEIATFGTFGFAFPFAAALLVGLVLDLTWTGAVLLGAALSSHTLISYPMIEQLRLLQRPSIAATIGGTLLTDTAALAVMIVVLELHHASNATGWMLPLALLTVLVATSLYCIPPIARYVISASKPTLPEKALFLLAVLLLLATLAELIGTEDILGAFLAGVCVNRTLHSHPELKAKLIFVSRMIFIPFFFVKTGMKLEISAFLAPAIWVMSVALITAVVLGKVTAAWISGIFHSYRRWDRILMIGLTLPQAAATLAVITIGQRAGLIGEETLDAVIVVILVTCLAGALVAQGAGRRIS